jgi:hypothetical protein
MRMPASSSPPRRSDSAPARHRLRALALEPVAPGLCPGCPPSRARAIVAAPEGARARTASRFDSSTSVDAPSWSARIFVISLLHGTGRRALRAVPIGARGSASLQALPALGRQ